MKTGILLTNLGTPSAPTKQALRKYLAEFLSDTRVVEIPKFLWWFILHGIVLRIRPKRSAALYKKIWQAGGSPLLVNSQALTDNLQTALGKSATVLLGMRYGEPTIKKALDEFRKNKVERIIVLPLYPQYSAATTGSTFDKVVDILKGWRYIPELHFISHYYADKNYTQAIADTIREHWQQQGSDSYLIFSYHGLPKRCVELGDPYQQQCLSTTQLIAENLQLAPDKFKVVFQSRFGKAEWLQPYCDKTLCELPQQGIKNVTVICPGFSVDCLETLEEIAQENRELFLQAGGEKFHYIPALNDKSIQVKFLQELLSCHL